MPTARIVRGDVLALKEREFVLAARSIGTTNFRLITRHVLPNVLSPIMVSATLGIANAIITESALSFLGLGFPPDFPTWGRLLFDATNYLHGIPRAGDLAGRGDLADGAVGELPGRRAARRARPAHPRALRGSRRAGPARGADPGRQVMPLVDAPDQPRHQHHHRITSSAVSSPLASPSGAAIGAAP